MELKTQDSPVIEKTKELCKTLVEQPVFAEIRNGIEAFSADSDLQKQYSDLFARQEELQGKHSQGESLSDDEVNGFERDRERFMASEVARNFMEAQQAMHKLQQTVGQYVSLTFRLGRVPTDDDFPKGGCGPNCGCSGKS